MDGSDSSFGSGGGSPLPADRVDEEGTSPVLHDDHDIVVDIAEPREPFSSDSDERISPHTKPFRAWGAAHERDSGPSLWARFSGWLGGLFRSEKSEPDTDPSATDWTEPTDSIDHDDRAVFEDDSHVAVAESESSVAEQHDSADGDALWSKTDSSSHPAELPKESDFEAPWDDPFAKQVDDGSSDPLWDEPRVTEAAPPPREVISSTDLNFVWNAPTPSADELIAEAQHSTEEATPPSAPARRKSFISRLFGRKKKAEPTETSFESDVAPTASEAPPTTDDFADEVHVTDTPAIQTNDVLASDVDFEDAPASANDRSVRAPSLDHSADDAAQLADLLASSYVPRPDLDMEPPVEPDAMDSGNDDSSLAPTEAMDLPFIDTEQPVEDAIDDVTSEPDLPEMQASDDEAPTNVADIEPPVVEQEPAAPPVPEKKLGFFSRLMLRRSQIRRAIPAVEPVVDEPPVSEPAAEEPADLEAAANGDDSANVIDLAETLDETMPEAPEEIVAEEAREEIRADTSPMEIVEDPRLRQPFAPFVDARDEIHQELAAERASAENARITEAVPQPVEDPFAEGEKTDEFEAVPEPGASEAAEQPVGFFARLFGRNQGETTQPVPVVEKPGAKAADKGRDLDDKPPFVLAKFRTFYNEIIRDKHQKSDVISGFATAIVSAAAADEADPEFAAQLLSKRLSEMLELQSAESNWTGGDAARYYPEAQYAMVALADETFSTIDWPGRPSWHKYMLEPKLYATRGADIEFFRRVDKLLREPNPPQGARDLARVYLLVIASGYRGKFRVPNLHRPLAEYRRRLYEFSHQADPLELYGRERRLLPETIEHTLAGRAVGRFTPAQKWMAAVVVLILAYGVVSHLAWTKLSADLKDVMSRIEAPAPGGGAR